MREIPHLALKTNCAGTARLGPFLGLLGPWGVTDKRSFALVRRRVVLWCWTVGATRDGPMRPAKRGSPLTTKHQGALEGSAMFSASRSKPRSFAVFCGLSLVSPPCGSKPLLQLTAGTERACGSVWLVIRPQAKIRVRALSCVHITSQGPRPSLCRVHTVSVLGR